MNIIFAIPTWNRAQQLEMTIEKIIASAEYAQATIKILISNNHSTDETAAVLINLQQKFNYIEVIKPEIHISGMENFQFVISSALQRINPTDYIWSFGDDDDISLNGVGKVAATLEIEKPYFASAGNTRLTPHKNNGYSGNIKELSLNFGFFLTLGFISQLIFSYELAKDIYEKKLMSEKFVHDSYSHGSSIIYLGHQKKGVYIDSPIATYRDIPNSADETRKRWESENVYDGIFNFVDSLKILTDENLLPKKINKKFFRYWKWHFWDFLLYNAALTTLSNRSNVNSKLWDKIYILTSYLDDAELTKRININTDLLRLLIASSGDNNLILNHLNRYEGIHTYNSYLGE